MPDRRRASNLSVLADAVSSEDDDARAYRAFGPRKRRLVPEDVGVGLEVVRRFANGGMRCRVEEEVHADHGRRVRVRWTTEDEDDGLSMRQTICVHELLAQLNGDRVAKQPVAPRGQPESGDDDQPGSDWGDRLVLRRPVLAQVVTDNARWLATWRT